jgi:hypothetical protein
MSRRLGLLFSDGSLLVLPEGVDFDAAWREAEEHDAGESDLRTEVVDLAVEITGRHDRNSVRSERPDVTEWWSS